MGQKSILITKGNKLKCINALYHLSTPEKLHILLLSFRAKLKRKAIIPYRHIL